MQTAQSQEELWKIAEEFRMWVLQEMKSIDVSERELLRGDYLFVIDEEPKFVVSIGLENCLSEEFSNQKVSVQRFEVLSAEARTQIDTDSVTLYMLLKGTLRPSKAFVSGRVKIKGDLGAFMRLVSHLRQRGVSVL